MTQTTFLDLFKYLSAKTTRTFDSDNSNTTIIIIIQYNNAML